MGLETTVNYISDLDPTYPTPGDSAAQGDDHIRNIKTAVTGSFPNINGPVNATDEELNSLIGRGIPTGGIIMWSGTKATIPTGWALCDGANGTPNLVDRFVVGATGKYNEFASGGAETVSLSTSNMPSHDHSSGSLANSTAGNHSHTITISSAGRHRHSDVYDNQDSNSGDVTPGSRKIAGELAGSFDKTYYTSYDGEHTHNATALNNGNHSHTISGRTGTAGSGTAFSIMPKYFALAYIMKL